MNGMNFKPFINQVLDSLSDEQVASLYNLMATHSNSFTNRSLINAANLLTSSDKGIGLFTIQLDSQNIKTGYLIYNNSYCVLLSYVSNSERVMEYEIDMSTMTYKPVKEFLTTDYLRHEVAIRGVEVGAIENVVTEAELSAAVADKIKFISVSNISGMSDEQLDSLKVGDVVQKITDNQKHCYIVTYKGTGAGTGICLTYTAAGYIETVSYDRDGDGWSYNSTDYCIIGVNELLSSISGYDSTKTQILKNVTGTLTWVDEE